LGWTAIATRSKLEDNVVLDMISTTQRGESMATTGNAQQQTKADFVRSLPKSLSTNEVIAKAKEAGIKLGGDYVYKVRSRERAKSSKSTQPRASAKKQQAVKRATPAPGTASATGKGVPSYEAVFVRAVVDLGFEQAQALLTRVRDRVLRVAAS